MNNFIDNPNIKQEYYHLCKTRRNEILSEMLHTDKSYIELCQNRTNASIALKKALSNSDSNVLFNDYSDAIYKQEIYELEAVYKQAFIDALNIVSNQKL